MTSTITPAAPNALKKSGVSHTPVNEPISALCGLAGSYCTLTVAPVWGGKLVPTLELNWYCCPLAAVNATTGKQTEVPSLSLLQRPLTTVPLVWVAL